MIVSLIPSSFCHSSIILSLNDKGIREKVRNVCGMKRGWGMIFEWMEWSYEEKDSEKEWPNDSWMREISELRVWPWFKNLPHFTLIPSFLDILEWRNWLEWSENEWDVLWMTSLLSSFSFLGIREWHPNDGMRRNEGDFGSGQKNWIPRCLSFCYHSVILSSFLPHPAHSWVI